MAKKLSLKTENTQFLTALYQVVLQDIKKSFEEAHLDAKIYWISSATPWNSTIFITLVGHESMIYLQDMKTSNLSYIPLHHCIAANNVSSYPTTKVMHYSFRLTTGFLWIMYPSLLSCSLSSETRHTNCHDRKRGRQENELCVHSMYLRELGLFSIYRVTWIE